MEIKDVTRRWREWRRGVSGSHARELIVPTGAAGFVISDNYFCRSTSNLVFSEWDKIFKNPMTTAAAIDRLEHGGLGNPHRLARVRLYLVY